MFLRDSKLSRKKMEIGKAFLCIQLEPSAQTFVSEDVIDSLLHPSGAL